MTTWMVRAGFQSSLIDEFKNKSIVSIGWNELNKIPENFLLEEIKKLCKNTYEDMKEGKINTSANQIYKFVSIFQKGDRVVTYDKFTRLYHIGTIQSEYKFNTDLKDQHHYREVIWEHEKSRDQLLQTSRNTLGATLTIFQLNDEIVNDLLKEEVEKEEVEETDNLVEDVLENSDEFLKDKILSLDWEMMQDLVAGLLRAMGYKTIVSPKGSDRGQDVIASPDGFGLEEPRIKVEVKHRKGQMGAPDIRNFSGGLRNEKGIYVSTGGFTKEAKYEAERSQKPLTCVDIELLVEMIKQYYETFDIEAKTILPLKKIYWPL